MNMKKKILFSLLIVAIAAVAGWSLSRNGSESTLADIALSNAEALADSDCPNGCLMPPGLCECHGWHYYLEHGYPPPGRPDE
jgi:hypothetical protein